MKLNQKRAIVRYNKILYIFLSKYLYLQHIRLKYNFFSHKRNIQNDHHHYFHYIHRYELIILNKNDIINHIKNLILFTREHASYVLMAIAIFYW